MTDPQNPGDGTTPPPYTPPPAADPAVPQAPAYGQQQAPAYGQQPPAYGQQPPAYGQQPYAAAPPAPYGAPASPTVPGKTMGIVALVLAIVPIGLQLVALILGIVALVQSRKAGHKNGIALAAIIVSSVLLVIGIIITVAVFAYLGSITGMVLENCSPGGSGFVEIWGQTIPCSELETTR